MASTKPTPSTLTLRLKFHRTSVLLHVDPILSISALKADLLHAIRDTHPDGKLHGRPLPASPSDLQLARLVDPADPAQGWQLIADGDSTPEGEEEDEEAAEAAAPKKKGRGRPKGKDAAAAADSGNGSSNGDKSMKSLGIKDGMALAFRWAGEAQQRDGETETLEWEDWDVKWPHFEDTFNLEDEGMVE
ncbi:uncharacterized protein BKA78DRAFT_379334 [Phyllosticta capitalensis]|uniref:uncharacterized protein n=1 Tax=Phyllosticta capitalensis TaxID=121624 RepID=UPI00312E2945